MHRVIVADGVTEFRQWLSSILNESGDFQVIGEAATGPEAINLIEYLSPDLVLADVDTPETDGLDIARYVRHYCPRIKAILISTEDEPIYSTLAIDENVLAFIPKAKFSLDTIRQLL